MAFLKQIKKTNVISRLQETQLFEYVMNEIKRDDRKEGVWGQALVASEGDQQKAEALYVKRRVNSLKDEIALDTIIKDEELRAIQMINHLSEEEITSKKPIYLSKEEQEAMKISRESDYKVLKWFAGIALFVLAIRVLSN